MSHSIGEDIPLWPGDPPVRFEPVASHAEDGFFLRRFSIGEHSATHMNAPSSFHPDGAGIDRYEPADLIREAVTIDVTDRAAADPDYRFAPEDLERWEERNGRVPAGSVVLLHTGWSRHWDSPERFLGLDRDGALHYPAFAAETTRFLLRERKIGGVGIDTHGVDPGDDETHATNTQVLAEPRIVLENLTNLDQLPATGTILVIAPLKLEGGSGSPATVTALIP